MQRAWIALGANLPGPAGPASTTLEVAMERIAALPGTRLTGRSRRYRSAPVDATGPDFLNQVVRVETMLAPPRLLGHLHAIEAALGRTRPAHGPRNPPRSLDLDLLLFADERSHEVIDLPDAPGVDAPADLPHPRMHLRLFVLKPLAELDPELIIPGVGRVRDCLATVLAAGGQDCEPVDG